MTSPLLTPAQQPHRVHAGAPRSARPARRHALTLGTVLALVLAVVAGPLAWTSAVAITWFNPVCRGFVACDASGLGNNGYEKVYTTSFWGMYPGHNCTNYSAYRLIAKGIDASYLQGQGMAYQWGTVAASHGVLVDNTPRVGDIAWFNQTAGLSTSGHVAYVEAVDLTAGTVRLSEDNYRGDFDWRSYYIRDVTGFIHFGAPASPPPPPASPPPPSAPAPLVDGTFVRVTETGEVARMAGGAPVWVSSWASFGGEQPTTAISAARYSTLPVLPRDGTYLTSTSGKVYRVAGGAPLYVSSWAHLGGVQPTVTVDAYSVDHAGGAGRLGHLLSVPRDGAFLRDSVDGKVYTVAGGAPSWISSWTVVGGPKPETLVDGWELDNYQHLRKVPADDVYLRSSPSGRFYAVSSGMPIRVTDWADYGGAKTTVTVDDAAVAACDHLSCSPIGHLDSVVATPGGAVLAGWTFDPSTLGPLTLSLESDGVRVASTSTTTARADVDRVWHAGTQVGFSAFAPMPAGTHSICARAIGYGAGGSSTLLGCSSVVVPAGSTVPVSPNRLLDTRTGFGVTAAGPRAPGSVTVLTVAGRGPVPTSGVGAVVLNVTVTGASAGGYLTVWPTGTPRPTVSNLNFVPGQTVPNLVLTPLGADGTVSVYNGSTGTTHLLADVSAYVVAGDARAAGSTLAGRPSRVLDTRIGLGVARAKVAPRGAARVTVVGRGMVPASGVSAVVLNVTAVNPTAAGYLTVYPSGAARPTTSNVNFLARQNVPNLVLVPVAPDGSVTVYNGSYGSTDVVADIAGFVLAGSAATPGATAAVTPSRVLDTRLGVAPAGPGAVLTIKVTGRGSIPATGVSAVVLNVTATGAARPGYLTVYAGQATRPNASNLNYTAGQTVPNLVLAPVAADGTISIYNGSAGTTHVVADVAGYIRR